MQRMRTDRLRTMPLLPPFRSYRCPAHRQPPKALAQGQRARYSLPCPTGRQPTSTRKSLPFADTLPGLSSFLSCLAIGLLCYLAPETSPNTIENVLCPPNHPLFPTASPVDCLPAAALKCPLGHPDAKLESQMQTTKHSSAISSSLTLPSLPLVSRYALPLFTTI